MRPFVICAVYFVLWWLSLFVTLPFGIRTQEEMGEVTLGTERGAPHATFLLRKVIATTLISGVLMAIIYVAISVYHLTLEDVTPCLRCWSDPSLPR
ncbi:Predicted secreted protein [Faunimonas pinastri]|uniref:Predicted secreted protein n=1 Tax=Faunimonas pinastri TaxID=1855383 RepID=A0A1H9KY47_9HYPH|nr:DUF1467 family protein [Faunimonas pinastri]SER03693.1 Predicted secreted protein [Faunimonas pinastri]